MAAKTPCPVCGGSTYTWSRSKLDVEPFRTAAELAAARPGILVTTHAVCFLRRCETCRNLQIFGADPNR